MPKKFLLEQRVASKHPRCPTSPATGDVVCCRFLGKSSPPSAEGAPWKTRLWGKSRVASRAVGRGAKFVATACHPSGDGPRRKTSQVQALPGRFAEFGTPWRKASQTSMRSSKGRLPKPAAKAAQSLGFCAAEDVLATWARQLWNRQCNVSVARELLFRTWADGSSAMHLSGLAVARILPSGLPKGNRRGKAVESVVVLQCVRFLHFADSLLA